MTVMRMKVILTVYSKEKMNYRNKELGFPKIYRRLEYDKR